PPIATLCPYTTLFRSAGQRKVHSLAGDHHLGGRPHPGLTAGNKRDRRCFVQMKMKNISMAEVLVLKDQIACQEGQVVSKTLAQKDRKSTRLNSSHVSI